jgi:predicted nucleic acid-binding protein
MVRLSLDTNILVYAIDPTHAGKHARAKQLVQRAAHASAALTQQVLGEYCNVALRRRPEEQAKLRESAEAYGRIFQILPTVPATILNAYDRAVRYKLQFWDAVILSVCLEHGCTHLLSEDLQDGQVIDGVTVLNPLLEANDAKLDRLFDAA